MDPRARPSTLPRRRRRLRAGALALVAVAATGCAAAAAKAHAPRTAQPSLSTATPLGTSTPAVPRQPPTPPVARVAARAAQYPVPTSESYPALKREAVRVALALTTYDAATSAAAVARSVTTDPVRARALAAAALPLVHPHTTSSGEVVYPQMGGATAVRASVMVVVRQVLVAADGTRRTETRTLDIRLARSAGAWRFDELASAGGTPVSRPASLSPAARAVLDDPRITLPDSARWDIYRGAVSPALLTLMEQVAQRAPYRVAVLETGHPHDVFGTSHASAHASGHAMDVYDVADGDVVRQHQAGSPAYDLVRWLLARPDVRQVGSPWDLDGRPSSRSFTNAVHLDHVHIAV